jgi:hypothetical protein
MDDARKGLLNRPNKGAKSKPNLSDFKGEGLQVKDLLGSNGLRKNRIIEAHSHSG